MLVCCILNCKGTAFLRKACIYTAPKSFNSSQRIFKTFIDLLIGSYPKDRRISYYAEKMAVTPKYLSVICKKCADQTASQMIDRYVIRDIEYLLRHTQEESLHFGLGFVDAHLGGLAVEHGGNTVGEILHTYFFHAHGAEIMAHAQSESIPSR